MIWEFLVPSKNDVSIRTLLMSDVLCKQLIAHSKRKHIQVVPTEVASALKLKLRVNALDYVIEV